jgi:GSH-dependent disulfide-bond oxidoreductase
MLTLHTWTTPNGRKPAIMLAELGLDYQLKRVDLRQGEQKKSKYLSINPNGKIPALTDDEVVVFESGAILLYLAEKTGRLLPTSPRAKAEVLSWLFWQVGGPGPFFGQVHHFRDEEPREERAYAHFVEEARRLASVLDGPLAIREYVSGFYSIADIAIYPWFAAASENMPEILADTKHVRPWLARMAARPAVRMGMALAQPLGKPLGAAP